MTPEQRLDRVENILRGFIRAGRRSRDEWNYRINSLIDAQIRNEAAWRAESHEINEQLKAVAVAQAELVEAHKLTEQSLRAFIDRQNG